MPPIDDEPVPLTNGELPSVRPAPITHTTFQRQLNEPINGQRTPAQIFQTRGTITDGQLQRDKTSTIQAYKIYREMRKDPTISLARRMVTAPLVSAGWSFEAETDAPEGALEYIKENLDKHRVDILKTALEGCFDYGWQAWELVQDYDPATGYIRYRKFKPLLQDVTDIMVHPDTGALVGMRQLSNGGYVDLNQDEIMYAVCDMEGTDWYGRSNMESMCAAWEASARAARSNDKYDDKIAGTKIVVKYPEGKTKLNGILTDNYEVASNLIQTMVASGAIAIPMTLRPYSDDMDDKAVSGWDVSLLSDTGSTRSYYIDRQKYLDTLKVRGAGLPERAILEGQYGTKAEADAHADFAITALELRLDIVVRWVNRYAVDGLLELNWGEPTCGKVFIQAAPLQDSSKEFLKELYSSLLSQPDGALLESDQIDLNAIRERLDVPSKPEEELYAMEQAQQAQQMLQQMLPGQMVGLNGTADPMVDPAAEQGAMPVDPAAVA